MNGQDIRIIFHSIPSIPVLSSPTTDKIEMDQYHYNQYYYIVLLKTLELSKAQFKNFPNGNSAPFFIPVLYKTEHMYYNKRTNVPVSF